MKIWRIHRLLVLSRRNLQPFYVSFVWFECESFQPGPRLSEKTGLKRSPSAHSGQHGAAVADPWPDSLESDPRWQLAQRVVSWHTFERSPLISRFLLYVVAETLMGRQNGITEHQIGVHVFGRQVGYRTDEDNIVRNYARQLRKRLAEYFADESDEGMRIEIPIGGYIPVFTMETESEAEERTKIQFGRKVSDKDDLPAQPVGVSGFEPTSTSGFFRKQLLSGRFWIAVYSAILVCCTWAVASHVLVPRPASEPAGILWRSLLLGANNTFIVPPDTGLNLLEDMSHRSLPLADYIKGTYADLVLGPVDEQTAQDLHTQQFTDFVSLQIATALARQQEYEAARIRLRFPRDLRLDDLKSSNAIIIGSVSSNPWAALVDSGTNFRIVPSADMRGASIMNANPQPGEAVSYASRWNEPAHETYALISFVPNLSGNGHILLLEGLDVAGTQSAAEVLFHSDAIGLILERAERPDGSLRPFEILLRSTTIQSNAAGSQIVATRIH